MLSDTVVIISTDVPTDSASLSLIEELMFNLRETLSLMGLVYNAEYNFNTASIRLVLQPLDIEEERSDSYELLNAKLRSLTEAVRDFVSKIYVDGNDHKLARDMRSILFWAASPERPFNFSVRHKTKVLGAYMEPLTPFSYTMPTLYQFKRIKFWHDPIQTTGAVFHNISQPFEFIDYGWNILHYLEHLLAVCSTPGHEFSRNGATHFLGLSYIYWTPSDIGQELPSYMKLVQELRSPDGYEKRIEDLRRERHRTYAETSDLKGMFYFSRTSFEMLQGDLPIDQMVYALNKPMSILIAGNFDVKIIEELDETIYTMDKDSISGILPNLIPYEFKLVPAECLIYGMPKYSITRDDLIKRVSLDVDTYWALSNREDVYAVCEAEKRFGLNPVSPFPNGHESYMTYIALLELDISPIEWKKILKTVRGKSHNLKGQATLI